MARRFGCLRRLALSTAVAMVAAAAPGVSVAQEARTPPDDMRTADEMRTVSGRVVRPAGDDVRPVARTWVVLHRVGPDAAGPLDSARTSSSGAFTFRYRTSGSPDAIYFVSAQHHGVAYFSAPLRDIIAAGDDAEIVVFDTTSAPVPIRVRGRHVVISAGASGGERRVIEVYELTNDSSVTRIAAREEQPVWTTRVPPPARDLQTGDQDPDPRAMTLQRGLVSLFTPIAPGLEQVAFSYVLPGDAFPLTLPIDSETLVLEVLAEGPAADITGGGLAETDPVSIEGRTFRRFLAQNVDPDAAVRIAIPAAPGARRQRYIAIVLAALGVSMVLALVAALARRPPRRASAASTTTHEADRLAHEITKLDASFDRLPAPSAQMRADYVARREALKKRLADVLAGQIGAS